MVAVHFIALYGRYFVPLCHGWGGGLKAFASYSAIDVLNVFIVRKIVCWFSMLCSLGTRLFLINFTTNHIESRVKGGSIFHTHVLRMCVILFLSHVRQHVFTLEE